MWTQASRSSKLKTGWKYRINKPEERVSPARNCFQCEQLTKVILTLLMRQRPENKCILCSVEEWFDLVTIHRNNYWSPICHHHWLYQLKGKMVSCDISWRSKYPQSTAGGESGRTLDKLAESTKWNSKADESWEAEECRWSMWAIREQMMWGYSLGQEEVLFVTTCSMTNVHSSLCTNIDVLVREMLHVNTE